MQYIAKDLFATHDWRGEKLPSIEQEGLEWVTVVPSLPNKVIIIEFWATWCGKCHEKIPLLNEIHKTYKDEVVVIGLTDENPDKIKKWLQTRDIEYYIAVDYEGKYRAKIGINGTPNILVIDNGVVQWQGVPNATDSRDPFNIEVIKKIVEVSKLPKLPAAKLMPITDTLISAPQPNVEQLKNLGVIGVKSVLNLRTNEEAGIIPNEERLLNPAIEYSQIPILYLSDIDESNVQAILATIARLPKPCLVHCNVGLCAVAAILLSVAADEKKGGGEGFTRKQFLEMGADLGINFTNQAKFYEFLGRYLG